MNDEDSRLTAILEADKISRTSNDGQLLVQQISLRIQSGDRIAIVGPSGAGKSVLLRAFVLLDPVSEGTIRWHGSPITKDAIPRFRSRVTYVHQQPQLLEGTVEQNLRMPFDLQIHVDQKFDRNRVIRFLQSVGRNESFLSKRHSDLSGGEAAIASLIRAIQLDPEVLLLDEPTAALDKDTTLQIESLVNEWFRSAENRALVWVSHNEDQVERISNRILRVENGMLRN